MTWKTHFTEAQGQLQVDCMEALSLDDLTMLAIETSFFITQNKTSATPVKTVLLDLANAHLEVSPEDLIELLDIFAEYHVPTATRLTIVLGTPARCREYAAVLPLVARHRYELKLFAGKDEATDWLNS